MITAHPLPWITVEKEERKGLSKAYTTGIAIKTCLNCIRKDDTIKEGPLEPGKWQISPSHSPPPFNIVLESPARIRQREKMKSTGYGKGKINFPLSADIISYTGNLRDSIDKKFCMSRDRVCKWRINKQEIINIFLLQWSQVEHFNFRKNKKV